MGIAGGKEKCDYIVKELGFDAAIDYKHENVMEGLRKHCAQGINVYFDNVGGDILDAALANLARGARVVLRRHISVQLDHRNQGAVELSQPSDK